MRHPNPPNVRDTPHENMWLQTAMPHNNMVRHLTLPNPIAMQKPSLQKLGALDVCGR